MDEKPPRGGNVQIEYEAPNSMAPESGVQQKPSCLQSVSNAIIGTLENGFEKLGLSIGKHPWRYICGCIFVSALCGLGLLAFNEVTESEKLWVPEDAQVIKDKEWIDTYYPSTVNREQIIAVASNILTPTGINALLDIYQSSQTISTSSGITLSDVCVKAGSNCLVYGILEFWSYNNSTIRALTQGQILSDINSITISPMYGSSIDISNYLGGRTTDPVSGNITAAEAAIMIWLTQGNSTMESTTEAWEEEFIELGKSGHADLAATYVFAKRSRSDVSSSAIQGDVMLLSIGYFIVIVFVLVVLGKFNLMEQRAWLTLGGFVCIGLSILVSIGLSSAFQQGYSSLQSVLPFLLLGIGVDDMFVIMGALNNLLPTEQKHDIPHKIADVLRHAGVSITVTSFTDFVAFMIGATTIIPALRSFCIYAAVGIIALYVLQAIFFTACMSLDLRRIQNNRDACCFMVKHDPPYKPNACSQKQLVPFVFKKGLARIVTKLPSKIITVMTALTLFGINIWGLVELEQYFDPNWFIPDDSYAYEFLEANDKYFPDEGASGYVYCGNIDYWGKKTQFETLDSSMSSSPWISNGTTDSWFTAMTSWLSTTTDPTVTVQLDVNKYLVSESAFVNLTYQLTTSQATRTSAYIEFATSSGGDITASRFPFRHISMNDASTEIKAMDSTKDLVEAAGFSTSECFPYSRRYLTWETNKVIQEELFRNLGLALLCVFIVTLILIANLWTSLLVFVGVLFTLVDVAGSMHFWGLTIDTVTTIILILSIGLAVDYSAHIGHMFMTIIGSRHARTKETVGEMGPPVFYGGFSTFLAFILLSNSNSYVFKTFFKVNFLVVLYGLFHGLIFLPVVLSWIGPDPYPTADGVHRHHHTHLPEGRNKVEDADKGQRLENPPFVKSSDTNKSPTVMCAGREGTTVSIGSSDSSLSPPPSQGSDRVGTPPPGYSSPEDETKKKNMPNVHT